MMHKKYMKDQKLKIVRFWFKIHTILYNYWQWWKRYKSYKWYQKLNGSDNTKQARKNKESKKGLVKNYKNRKMV